MEEQEPTLNNRPNFDSSIDLWGYQTSQWSRWGAIILHGLHSILICGNGSVTCSDDSLD
jgi:hypothetical protein